MTFVRAGENDGVSRSRNCLSRNKRTVWATRGGRGYRRCKGPSAGPRIRQSLDHGSLFGFGEQTDKQIVSSRSMLFVSGFGGEVLFQHHS